MKIPRVCKEMRMYHASIHVHLPSTAAVTWRDLYIPVDELRERISELDRKKPVYVICQSGLRSYIATRILTGNGFDCYNFAGGFRFYDAVYNDKALNKKSTPCGMDN